MRKKMMQTFKFLLRRAAAESLQKDNIIDNFHNEGSDNGELNFYDHNFKNHL